ncbi:MAG: hypothetical protein R6U44_05390 [Archaeoglobaceae archaeon]
MGTEKVVRPDYAIERNWCFRCMHYTPSYKSRKCKSCDVFYNPLEVYEGKTPNNFEEGYRTQVLVNKEKKKVYINTDELRHSLSDNEMSKLLNAGCAPVDSDEMKELRKDSSVVRGQSVKAKTSRELVNKIKNIKEKL